MKDYKKVTQEVMERGEKEMQRKRQIKKRMMYGGGIASLYLVCILGVGLWQNGKLPDDAAAGGGGSNAPAMAGNADCYSYSTQPDGAAEATSEAGDEPVGESSEISYKYNLPAVTLPKDDMVEADMIGCLYYQGGVYTESGYYSLESDILDEKIGEANGKIDEWSSREDKSAEFASTYLGEVYTVKGYDPSFRLAIKEKEFITVLDRLNGIGISTGYDLFEERLHLYDNMKSASYLTHEDWDAARTDNKKPLTCTEKELKTFLKIVEVSEFEYTYETCPEIYSTEKQGHLFLNMQDGTTAELRLMDGGYVGYQALGWYMVKISPENMSYFNTVFDTIQ